MPALRHPDPDPGPDPGPRPRPRLLVVSWYYPPANTIAAVRLNKLTAFLDRQGIDVRVVTARDLPTPQGLASDLPGERAVHTRWTDVTRITKALRRLLPRRRTRQANAGAASPAPRGAEQPSPRQILRELLFFPDYQVGWIPHGLRAGKRLGRAWRPDAVYASGPPFSTLVIGWRLARHFNLPLVVEFRDRWSDDPYYPPSRLRQRLDAWLERRIIQDARGIVTVSEPWAETYRARFGKPTLVLYNGYDPELVAPGTASLGRDGPLRIVYTGGIYPGRRDPSLLFEAIRKLGADPQAVVVEFYGTQESHVWPLAERHGVSACVRVHPPIPHPEAMQRQVEADVLLLMQWQDPREQGNVPGKLFEYLGARRPILLIGLEGGVPHRFITARAAGHLARDGDHVAGLLRDWMAQKQAHGAIPLLPQSVSHGLSHFEQFARLPDFLEKDLGLIPSNPARSP